MTATTAELDTRTVFAEIFAEIAAGAVERERKRELPYEAVRRLKEAGFGSLRVPVEYGGAGLSFTEFFDLLIELGKADSNLPQLLRGHIAFVELVLASEPGPNRDFWLGRFAAGDLVGNAQSELGTASILVQETRFSEKDGGWAVDGRKYYSTGSIFADWIYTSGVLGEEYTVGLVPTAHPGVERLDDWDGFGQRLTGSGTTVFTGAPVAADHLIVYKDNVLPTNTQLAVLQLVHLATLSGIAQAVRDDAVAFVRQRTRNGFGAQVALPREDPQVQQVVGEVAARAFGATAAARQAALAVQNLQELEQAGTAGTEDYWQAEAAVYQAQLVVIEQTLQAATDLFRVGGASATSEKLALDRHWRNARTVSSHNPEVFRARSVGAHLLNGGSPSLTSLTQPQQG
jgi:alkylation response protein AidB-like acyl-CoA dehydrogenase